MFGEPKKPAVPAAPGQEVDSEGSHIEKLKEVEAMLQKIEQSQDLNECHTLAQQALAVEEVFDKEEEAEGNEGADTGDLRSKLMAVANKGEANG
jgi:hypothetical protein